MRRRANSEHDLEGHIERAAQKPTAGEAQPAHRRGHGVEAPANRQLQRRAGVELDQAADGLHDAVLGGEDVLHEGAWR